MKFNLNRWSRKVHRWGAVGCCLPLLLMITTGLLLQVKKQSSWVQPPTQRGSGGEPAIAWSAILEAARRIPETEVETWADIDRLDVRPGKGVVKVRCANRWEVQLDLVSSEVLSRSYRRSDLIESLHDGSFFHEFVKLGVFLPTGVILLGLWVTGVWLWYLPIYVRRKKKRRRAARGN